MTAQGPICKYCIHQRVRANCHFPPLLQKGELLQKGALSGGALDTGSYFGCLRCPPPLCLADPHPQQTSILCSWSAGVAFINVCVQCMLA